MASPANKLVSASEYLEWEVQQDLKHEFLNGHVWALSGVSRSHDRLTTAIYDHVLNGLRGKPYEPFGPDIRVSPRPGAAYFYPDFKIVCGEPKFEDDRFDTLLNPKVIFEVLSPSTERFDRGRKFLIYREIDSLTDYVLLSQEEMLVEHYSRDEEGWRLVTHTGSEDALELSDIGLSAKLADLYAKVEFSINAMSDPTELPASVGESKTP